MKKVEREEIEQDAKKFFNDYKRKIGESIRTGRVAYLSFDDIQFYQKLSEKILDNPEETIAIMESALADYGLSITDTTIAESGLIKKQDPKIRFTELPKSINLKIRNLRAEHLDKMVWIEGIVRQASDVRPQVTNAKFECPSCGAILSVLQIDTKFTEPSKCSCQWKGNFNVISKNMIDVQRIVLEESPDMLEGGEQPRKINVFVKEDLVEPKMEEKTTPGSKIKIYGVLKEVPMPLKTGISTRYDIAVESNNIIPLEETLEDLKITEEDIKQILELAADPNIFGRLSQSIAPSIYGFEDIKEAVLLQIFGGVKKTKSDGGKTRGDTHILLVGDPGVAKSVLLKFISTIAPKGRYVSGKAATGAGLTATVIKDEFLRGWSLEAGAMVLSNKGTVCIDEIEKMSEHDRSTMHEAMEQQTVTIAKANIHATLRAETSVLAAGNPKLGRFSLQTPIAQQIDISPALLSRFDVIFVIKDIPNQIKDKAIATHVLEEHKQEIERDIIEPKLLRKYIAYAKQKFSPKLTEEAVDEIRDFYVKLRNLSTNLNAGPQPVQITARQLEGIIRLSEAHAKMRLSNEVRKEDSKKAINLVKMALMQVGYDEETQSIDIDKAFGRTSSSQRNKAYLVREAIMKLESQLGKLIPIEEIIKSVEGKLNEIEFEDTITKLIKESIIFKPKNGYVQRV